MISHNPISHLSLYKGILSLLIIMVNADKHCTVESHGEIVSLYVSPVCQRIHFSVQISIAQ